MPGKVDKLNRNPFAWVEGEGKKKILALGERD